ncbi:MAG TPA: hypothetical protein PKJ63_10940 [Cyclobacteriaceae bacterium]|nr:hypothetical protein [Cyclobacteriaceae bacterium]
MTKILILLLFLFAGSAPLQQTKPELVCIKNHKSRNTCYYNFKIEGVKYNFTDIGCRYTKAQILTKIEEGTIALGKGWKVPC